MHLYHSAFQGKIIKYFNWLLDHGEAFPESALATEKGTKVSDVVWCSSAGENNQSLLVPLFQKYIEL
ncbi:MAG: hypothetical protein D3923_13065 [Candidatus Electrothrix sp. AR3]|nr:hypothetical protein [Candidatus Electrothrix sp. AR3]